MTYFPGKLKDELAQELEHILKYWTDFCLDNEFGGFVGRRDHFNRQINGASKGVVLNTRILWTFSAAYNFTHNPEYLVLADRAYQYINENFSDKQFGGLFWELDEKGEVLNSRKQIYAQGFGIYGFSEYYKASNNPQVLEKAIALFESIEKYSYDLIEGGYFEAFANDWSVLEDFRLSPKDANEPKSMNTHLHILEPYTNLLKIWPNERLRKKTATLIRIFLDKIIDHWTHHFNLFFANDWKVQSSIISFGHDIEGAWLLYEAAKVVGDQQLIDEVSKNLVQMVDVTIADCCAADGSVFNEKDKLSGHLDDDKHWWMQAEAMVGLAYAWKITGKNIYKNQLVNVWQFIRTTMIDWVNGEWFWRVDKDGIPIASEDKVGLWKCPYHNSRAMMEVITIISELSGK
ncbi:MAG TPA: AGE family epimerase/isomerase [Prolixibacteraceae bacterium]|nr:AGE family epimerase/isomerase [Prolixibacteraceae bacterium]